MFPRLLPHIVLSTLAVAAFAAPAPALAQMDNRPPPAMIMMQTRMMGPPSPEMEKARAEHRAQRAKDMHVILRLRPDQEAAWQAFESAMAPPSSPSGMDKAQPAPGGVLQRLDMEGKQRASREARHARMDAAVRSFYAALGPDQQQVFDALTRMRGGPGGRGGEDGPHMMMGPPPHP